MITKLQEATTVELVEELSKRTHAGVCAYFGAPNESTHVQVAVWGQTKWGIGTAFHAATKTTNEVLMDPAIPDC